MFKVLNHNGDIYILKILLYSFLSSRRVGYTEYFEKDITGMAKSEDGLRMRQEVALVDVARKALDENGSR